MPAKEYDAIIIDPPPPVPTAGSSLLYSQDFYAVAKQRLEPGGILQQWLPEGDDPTQAAVARAICTADGRTGMVEAAIGFRLPSGTDGCYHGKSGTQRRREGRIVQCDLDWNTLYDFCEVASRVVGWQQGKL